MSDLLTFPIFPLAGALLLPRAHLPLHIFEPRYRAMVQHAVKGAKRIGMVQPKGPERGPGDPPSLFEVGCLGEIVGLEELEDGRFNVVLQGLGRFRIARELSVGTPFRQVEATLEEEGDEPEPLASILRADLEREARRYADALGLSVDWAMVGRLDDEMLVNGIAQVAPLDGGSKQALLEAADMAERADMLVQFMAFQRMAPGGADGPQTLQ